MMKTRFMIAALTSHTFITHRGSTAVDLFLYRVLSTLIWRTLEWKSPSDRIPVLASFPFTSPAILKDVIFQALFSNYKLTEDATWSYKKHLP